MSRINSYKEDDKKAEKLMNRLDSLSRSKQSMSIQEAQEILDDFARILIFLNESSCYPSPYKPESLLPRSKAKVEIAFAIAMKYAIDSERKHLLYLNYSDLIDEFRSDNEAEAMNNSILSRLSNQKLVSKPGQN